MIGEINPIPLVRLSPGDEAKTQKPATELYIGQIMKAVVVNSMADDSAVIQLNQQFFQAKTPFRFQPGQVLDVEVIAAGQQPVLKLQQSLATNPDIHQHLAQFLPKQGHPLVLLEGLSYAYQHQALPENVKIAIANTLQNIPNAQNLGQNFITQLLGSGIFLEHLFAKLKQDLPNKTNDFKALLFGLRYQFQSLDLSGKSVPIPADFIDKTAILGAQYMPESFQESAKLAAFLAEQEPMELLRFLHSATEASIARIHTQQLLIAEHQTTQPHFLLFDIPVRNQNHFDCVSFRFEEKRNPGQLRSEHSVHFALSPENLGAIEGSLRMQKQELELQLYLDKPETLRLFEAHRPELCKLLESQDITVKTMNITPGSRPQNGRRSGETLVDISL